MAKDIKTNAMRILEKNKISYKANSYECDEFIDGLSVAKKLKQPIEKTFKTLVTQGRSKNYFVFVIPVDKELDLKKAAKAVCEKSVEMIHVKDINKITGYIRGGCTPLGMKKQFPTIIDSSALKFNTIFISGGKIGLQIEVSPNDIIHITNGRFEAVCF